MKECPACRRCFPDDIIHCPQDGDATLPSLLGDPILDARYQLERRLGQGGMGVVFHARHIFLKTQHAIKIILPDLVGNDPMLVTRFRQEALAAAAVRHPNIISVTDFGVVRSTMPFLVMEFVKGKSLQEIMAEEGAMPAARAFELICPTAAGVAAAHRQNIVHRDLKPLNIMIQDNIPVAEGLKILDFGLAKIKSGELLGSFVQAKTSGLMGSPFYMAPEQWSDEEPDARADIYSLGIILYQMLSGDVPFKGSSIPSIMKKHLTESPPSLKSRGVTVPHQIEAVVRHALAKEVGERTPSVEAFLKELNDAVSSVSFGLKTTSDSAEATETSPSVDPNKTMVSMEQGSQTGSMEKGSGFETNFDPHAGTISSSALDEQLQQQLSTTSEAIKRERADKERFARDELAREEEQRQRTAEQDARKRAEEDERQRKEREEREEKDRKHREQLDRVARQAEELEEKLARLATSMVPHDTAAIDPEATQVHQRTIPGQVIVDNSLAGARVGQQTQAPFQTIVPEKKKSPAILIGVVLLLVVLAGAGIGGYLMLRPQPGATNGNINVNRGVNGNTNNGGPTETTFKPDLVSIPGGTFQMGRNNGPPQETPAHPVNVQPFAMDKTEVTNGEYAEFVRETNHAAPSHWNGTKPPFGQELWPIVNVSLDDAVAFAGWRSKRDGVTYRLPTEAEWEYAARNGEGADLYPWGKEWKPNQAVLDEGTPAEVGSHPSGNNKWGVEDLIGNVWEWTSSKVSSYPGNPVTIPTSTQDWVAIRGGAFVSKSTDKDNPVSSCMRTFLPPGKGNPLLGFRLVRAAP
jgi:formylglycine-generating enzyme required for sulfatase activity/serine/threonine protein kinase